jgi:hypothetical protein
LEAFVFDDVQLSDALGVRAVPHFANSLTRLRSSAGTCPSRAAVDEDPFRRGQAERQANRQVSIPPSPGVWEKTGLGFSFIAVREAAALIYIASFAVTCR